MANNAPSAINAALSNPKQDMADLDRLESRRFALRYALDEIATLGPSIDPPKATEERAEAQFGFLMEALKFGAPPMGGFALGLDRVCMLLTGSDSIREVMAFPKTSSGSDLMSGAPSEVSGQQLKEVSLRIL